MYLFTLFNLFIFLQNGISQSASMGSGPSEISGSTHNLVHQSKTTPSLHSINGAYQDTPFSYQNPPPVAPCNSIEMQLNPVWHWPCVTYSAAVGPINDDWPLISNKNSFTSYQSLNGLLNFIGTFDIINMLQHAHWNQSVF